MAKEVLAKKLGLLPPNDKSAADNKNKLLKLIQEPLSTEAMEAIEDLLQVMNVDTNKTGKNSKKKVGQQAQ